MMGAVARMAALARGLALAAAFMAAPGAAAANGCDKPVRQIFEAVSPGVVTIATRSVDPYSLGDRIQRGEGSGFVVEGAGLVVTNAHVVLGAQGIAVAFADGQRYAAELVGMDPVFDLALLRIDAPGRDRFPTVPLGHSERVRVGDDVVAVGNPLGLGQSLTRGVVSASQRILPAAPFPLSEPYIQTDTAINPGNSGGPLVDGCGRVVGINTAIIEGAQNVGFAIPVDLLRKVLPALKQEGRVIRPWLGFHGQLIGPEVVDLLNLPLKPGFLVEVVEAGSPAEANGMSGGRFEVVVEGHSLLVGGDVVTHINGSRLDSPGALAAAVGGLKVGERVRLTVFRDGRSQTIGYRLPERPLLPSDLPGGAVLAPAGLAAAR